MAGGRPVGALGSRAAALRKVYDDLQTAGKISDANVQEKLYALAIAGDVAAIREYNDRRFGKPPQSLEVEQRSVPAVVRPGDLTPEEWTNRFSGAGSEPEDDDVERSN